MVNDYTTKEVATAVMVAVARQLSTAADPDGAISQLYPTRDKLLREKGHSPKRGGGAGKRGLDKKPSAAPPLKKTASAAEASNNDGEGEKTAEAAAAEPPESSTGANESEGDYEESECRPSPAFGLLERFGM